MEINAHRPLVGLGDVVRQGSIHLFEFQMLGNVEDDGVRVAQETVVVALGIDTEGVKHIVGLREGATENARVVRNVLEDVVERGLNTERPFPMRTQQGQAA